MSTHSLPDKRLSTEDNVKARVLIQETYDDAVKFLYGYEGVFGKIRLSDKLILTEMKFRVKVDEMTPLQVVEVERCMKTDRKWHFLGSGESLEEVIRGDLKTLNELGITPQQIADRLESLTGKAYTRWREEKMKLGEDVLEIAKRGILIENRYFIVGLQDRSTLEQPCCFELVNIPECSRAYERPRSFGAFQYRISKGTLKGKLGFPEVMIHLIGDHHFFGGKKSPLRLEPKRIVRFLDLQPGKDYKPKTKQLLVWEERSFNSSMPEKSLPIIDHGEKRELGPGIVAYVQGDKGIILSVRQFRFEKPPRIDGVEVELDKNEVKQGQTHIRRIEIDLIKG